VRRADLERRRCLLLQLAIAFGILLAALTRTWIAAVTGLAGSALAAFAYWRDCRRSDEDS
jgi:hypothetical protein